MHKPIHLHPLSANSDSQRLNMVAGRHLSEQEFDLMQRYVDQRCEKLLLARYSGIVEGLAVSVNHNGSEINVRVQPGVAISGDGRAVRLFYPLDLDWPSLLEEYQASVMPLDAAPSPVHGFYFITLKQSVGRLDESDGAEPCQCLDPNPLRDSRIETFATLGLMALSDIESLMEMPPERAINRLLVSRINKQIFDPVTHAIPLALVKVEHGVLTWVDSLAGRYMAEKDSTYQNFLRVWESLLPSKRLDIKSERSNSLAENIGLDYLPAAGSFPTMLVSDIAGSEDSNDARKWLPPEIHFAARSIEVELLPVPASTVQAVIDKEFSRGVVDLVHYQQDRIRLMVAVDDDAYRPQLMNLPEIDAALVDELYRREVDATSGFNEWANQYQLLYGGLDRDASFSPSNLPDDDTQALFDAIYIAPGPEGVYVNITNDEQRSNLKIPVPLPAPLATVDYLKALSTKQSGRPYSLPTPEAPGDLQVVDVAREVVSDDGLYRQQFDLKQAIERIEEDLETSFELLDEFSDFISVQRQHLDSITVSFASLSGGVQGDGSGLNLMRWSGAAKFIPQKSSVKG